MNTDSERQARRLESWKEIADYLGRDRRTVQRWEKTLSLPIHRHLLAKSGYVYAFTNELDLWRDQRLQAPRAEQLKQYSLVETPESPRTVGTGVAPHLTFPSGRLQAILAATSILLCLGLALWKWKASGVQNMHIVPVPFTTLPGDELSPSFSPDGKTVVFTKGSPDASRFSLYVKPVSGGPERRITSGPMLDYSPVWSPLGNRIAFLRGAFLKNADLWVVFADGSSPRKLASEELVAWPSNSELAWMPDARSLIVPGEVQLQTSKALFLVPVDGGARRQLTFPPAYCVDSSPAVSKDSTALLFSRACRGSNALYRCLLSHPGSVESVTLPALKDPASISICRPRDTRDFLIALNRSAITELWRTPTNRRPSLVATLTGAVTDIAASPQADTLVYTAVSADANLWGLRISGARALGSPRLLDDLASTRNEYNPQYSPDGRKLAFESDRTGSPEVWVSNVDGSEPKPLTRFGGPVTGSPAWSFDGKLLAFDTRVKGHPAIFSMTAEGAALKCITSDAGSNVVPSFSHDGESIYFASGRTGTTQVWRIYLDGTGARQITTGGGFAAEETPDGRFLYYTKSRDAITSLWRAPAEGGAETKVADSVVERAFTVAEKGVYFVKASDPRGVATIEFLGFHSAGPVDVAAIRRPPLYRLTISPSQDQLVWGQTDRRGADLMIARDITK